jgi:hypothetical protein
MIDFIDLSSLVSRENVNLWKKDESPFSAPWCNNSPILHSGAGRHPGDMLEMACRVRATVPSGRGLGKFTW